MRIRTLKLRGRKIEVGRKTLVMGILNLTPDSFSGDGIYDDPSKSIALAMKMVEEGADMLDLGGESSRPGSEPVSAEEELKRVAPVLKGLVGKVEVPISVDTYKPEVAKEALELGANLINDITGLRNAQMAQLVSDYNAGVVIMHMKGDPKTMQESPVYENGVVNELRDYLKSQTDAARGAGIKRQSIIIDPGIGFGKTIEHNLEIIRNLKQFKKLGFPVLVGPSRKSFIGKILNNLPADQRLEGTLAAIVAASIGGADIIRVHDVKECVRAIRIADAIYRM